MVFGTVYQQIENCVIGPRITARTVQVHPAVALGSVIVGASLLGAIGALVAIPVVAAVQSLIEPTGSAAGWRDGRLDRGRRLLRRVTARPGARRDPGAIAWSATPVWFPPNSPSRPRWTEPGSGLPGLERALVQVGRQLWISRVSCVLVLSSASPSEKS